MGIDFHVKVDLPVNEIMADFSVGGAVQREWDSIVLNGSRKYVPKREGILEASGDINTALGSGQIIYRTPYARYLWYGVAMEGVPRQPTDRPLEFSREKNALAGSFWVKRAWNDNKVKWTNQLQDFINGR